MLAPVTIVLLYLSLFAPIYSQDIPGDLIPISDAPQEGDPALGDAPLEGQCSNNYECSTYACCGKTCKQPTCLFNSECDDKNPCTDNGCSTKITDAWGLCEAVVRFPDVSQSDDLAYQCGGTSPTCQFVNGDNTPKNCPTTSLACQCPDGYIAREGMTNKCGVDSSKTGTLSCQAFDNACGSTENHYENNCNIGNNAASGSCVCCLDADADGVCDAVDETSSSSVCTAKCINANSPDGNECSLAGASGFCSNGNCVLSNFVSLPSRFMFVINETVVIE